jgi:RNA polymerase sigma-70 factor (ECF subfamily)
LPVTVSINKYQSKSIQSTSVPEDFETCFQEHWDRVYGVLYRIVGDHAEAEDLALETFLRYYQRPPRANTNIPGWLYRVATNLGLNTLRARKRRIQYETQAGKISLGASQLDNPEATVEKAEEQQRVRQVLARMKPRFVKILVLRHAGCSYAEVAAAVGISTTSVGTLLARAERDFKKRYQALEG